MIAIRLSPANRDRIRASIPAPALPDEDLTAMVEEYGNRPQANAIYFIPDFEVTDELMHLSGVGGWGTIPSRYLLEYYDLEKPIDNMNFEFVKINRK